MPRTYTYDPYNVPIVFGALVRKVSTNLSTDDDLPLIPYVKYKFGTWLEILDQLVADSKSPAHKTVKYPLVCLIQRFPENYEDINIDSIKVDIVIVNISGKTDLISKRYDVNFSQVLNPIYAELKQVIADSHYFMGSNINFKHTKYDIPHMGTESTEGETGYMLPDTMDGILMKDVQLKLNTDSCARCVLAYMLDYADFYQLSMVYDNQTNIMSVLATNANEATYKLYIGETEQLGFVMNSSYGLSLNGFPDGTYIVKVESSTGSKIEGELTIVNGLVDSYTNEYQFNEADPVIPCGINPTVTWPVEGNINAWGMIFIDHQVYFDETQIFQEALSEDGLIYSKEIIIPDTEAHKLRHFINTPNNLLTQIFFIKLKTT